MTVDIEETSESGKALNEPKNERCCACNPNLSISQVIMIETFLTHYNNNFMIIISISQTYRRTEYRGIHQKKSYRKNSEAYQFIMTV